jgi:hypothetical protein
MGVQVNTPAIMSNMLNATRNLHRYSVGSLEGKRYHPTRKEQAAVSCELQFPLAQFTFGSSHLASLV